MKDCKISSWRSRKKCVKSKLCWLGAAIKNAKVSDNPIIEGSNLQRGNDAYACFVYILKWKFSLLDKTFNGPPS